MALAKAFGVEVIVHAADAAAMVIGEGSSGPTLHISYVDPLSQILFFIIISIWALSLFFLSVGGIYALVGFLSLGNHFLYRSPCVL